MATYEITQTVNYSGTVVADNEEQARAYFIEHAAVEFYESVESESIEEIEEEED